MAIGAGIGSVFGGFAGWFFRRRYENASAVEKEADAEGKIIDNEIKLADYYKEMLDDLGQRYEKKFEDVTAAHDKRFAEMEAIWNKKEEILQAEINLLTNKNKMQEKENAALRKRIKELEPATQ